MIAPNEKVGISELESPIKIIAVKTVEDKTETIFHEEALQKMFLKINEIIRHINSTEDVVISKEDKEILDVVKTESEFAEHLWNEVQKGPDQKAINAAKDIFEGVDKIEVYIDEPLDILKELCNLDRSKQTDEFNAIIWKADKYFKE